MAGGSCRVGMVALLLYFLTACAASQVFVANLFVLTMVSLDCIFEDCSRVQLQIANFGPLLELV